MLVGTHPDARMSKDLLGGKGTAMQIDAVEKDEGRRLAKFLGKKNRSHVGYVEYDPRDRGTLQPLLDALSDPTSVSKQV